ncbi:MAG: DNA repair protein RadA [Candidatus Zixiibacteriota bacterium]|nr:MAG: DNA repair protein RadA [candidate division Zixibacteria bacterium]
MCGIAEFDRVLGGAFLPGMSVLLAGDPGIGKSTLLLQAAEAYARHGRSVLYVAGEESATQIKVRAGRLGVSGQAIMVLNSTSVVDILSELDNNRYDLVMVDSIQTISSDLLDSPPGTVGQVRDTAGQLITRARQDGSGLCLVGHVTKDGLVAGPKVLEHMVDTVLYFEGDQSHQYRILRAMKNRFGSVAEIGLFEMTASGLTEVANPSSFFLSTPSRTDRTGAVVTGICEGNRPLLIEVQALVTAASYGTPQRVAGGIDAKKLALLLAILEKRCDYPMGSHDVFVSVAGGLRVNEPSIDLPIMMAIVSSLTNRTVSVDCLTLGEVGLAGEVRAVARADQIVAEAARLGFTRAVIPKVNCEKCSDSSMSVFGVDSLETAIDIVLT